MPSVDIEASLSAAFPKILVDQLLETYAEMKSNFYLGRLRPSEVEGGRFSESVFRILEFQTTGSYTPLGVSLDTEKLIRQLSQLSSASHPDSVRLHIPRTLRVIYDIRNKRDAAHLADGIDPNLQDASFVSACCDWILAELVRLYHGCSSAEASALVEDLVTRKAPVVQAFGSMLKTLRPSLSLPERLLVLLYQRAVDGATTKELTSWVKPSQRKQVGSVLWKLVHDRDQVVELNGRYHITRAGQLFVESRRIMD
jgi:hypothetical protein